MENDNPKDISELERIKWLISRIDLYHKIALESVERAKSIFDIAGDKSLNKIKARRKGFFSFLAIILSVTFGISTFQPIELWIVYAILSIVSVLGFSIYVIFNYAESLVENSFLILSDSSNVSRTYIAEAQSFVASQFADLGYLKIKSIKNYGSFALLLHVAILVNMMNEIKKLKTRDSNWLEVTLKNEFDQIEELTKQVPALYEAWDSTGVFPELCQKLVEKTLKKYKKSDKK